MIRYRFFNLIVLMLALLFGCNQPAREVKLIGINGEANYYFDRYTNEVVLVIKPEYYRPVDYIVEINKDTLQSGDIFEASFGIFHEKFRILVNTPRKEIIEGSYSGPEPGKPYELLMFKYEANRGGTYILSGQIEYDTTVVPFEYKFLVVEK